ncbi:MAG: UDP-N-acetylmuramoyl-L-alanine--D-glutamate ligase [Rhodocyclales bacterium]|nr:UDP-N-acetylmuramoyl-L-alanine--D-glutamate ligase [Rhodocyclales bacterium]
MADMQTLVLGLGESGLAMVRWLARQGVPLRVADSRTQPPGLDKLARLAPAAQVQTGPFSLDLLEGVGRIAISPGIDPRQPLIDTARARGIPVVGEMDLLVDALVTLGLRAQTRILAITGTNGKTTTTTLVGAMLQHAGLDAVVAGNISPAALDVLVDRLEADQPPPAAWVLELSSFQLETAPPLAPDSAVVLNVTDDHLDRYADLDAYAATKAAIYKNARVAVLNRQDARVQAMVPAAQAWSFGLDAPLGARGYGLALHGGEVWLFRGDEPLMPRAALPLAGQHNVANALAALALAEGAGIDRAPLLETLKTFRGLPHRVELVGVREDGLQFFDDSKGTNVGATVAALEGLGRPVVLIAGGDGKGQDFSPLREVFAAHTRAVVLIGRDAPLIEAAVQGCGVPLVHASDMDQAVARAVALAEVGDVVMLSPACASMDMFRNYAHRAEVFVNALLALPGVRRP